MQDYILISNTAKIKEVEFTYRLQLIVAGNRGKCKRCELTDRLIEQGHVFWRVIKHSFHELSERQQVKILIKLSYGICFLSGVNLDSDTWPSRCLFPNYC